jgi:hypothetical protein
MVWRLDVCGRESVGVSKTGVGECTDPLAGILARLLTAPLREVYAVLWRVGLLEIVD